MRVAITGSSGLIGSRLVRALRERGDDVVRVVRSEAPGDGATVRWDIDAGTLDAAGLEGCDGVVHLAGEGIGERRWSEEQKQRIRDSRTKGTALLASTLAGLDRPPRVLVSGSAIGFYGDRGDEVLTEESGHGAGFLADVVVAWEAAAGPAVDAGIRTAFARTGIVQDPDGGALAKVLPLFKLGLGGRLGPGSQWWSWISVTDEVRAILHLLDGDLSGPVNLTALEPVTNAEYTKVLASVLRRPSFLPVPKFGPKLLLGGEAAEEMLFASQRVVPKALEEDGFTFTHPDLEAALRDLLG